MAEELSIVNGRLYVAAGTSGVWAADLTAAAPVLTRIGQGSLPWVDGRTDAASVSATVVRGVETVLLGLDADVGVHRHVLPDHLAFGGPRGHLVATAGRRRWRAADGRRSDRRRSGARPRYRPRSSAAPTTSWATSSSIRSPAPGS